MTMKLVENLSFTTKTKQKRTKIISPLSKWHFPHRMLPNSIKNVGAPRATYCIPARLLRSLRRVDFLIGNVWFWSDQKERAHLYFSLPAVAEWRRVCKTSRPLHSGQIVLRHWQRWRRSRSPLGRAQPLADSAAPPRRVVPAPTKIDLHTQIKYIQFYACRTVELF